MQGISAKHRVFGRSIGELDERDPSLINLPLPVNSIPIVGPLASPLVGDGASDDSQPSSPASPQPAPISTAGSGNGGGSEGSNGGGNGGGNGSSNGGDNTEGNTPIPAPSPTSGGGSAVPQVPAVPNSALPNSITGLPPGSSGTNGGMPSPSGRGGGDFPATVSGQTALVNALFGSSTTISASLGITTPAALATGLLSPSQSSLESGSSTIGAAAPTPTTSAAATLSSGEQLSVGAVVGITLACLFVLLFLVLLVVRCRSIAQRLELRRKWWFSRNASGHSFPFTSNGSTRSPVGQNGETTASRPSARSSFATNFDQGLMFRLDSPPRVSLGLDLPPTAEVRERKSVLFSTGGLVARRESMNSMLSNGNDPDVQYLIVPTGQNGPMPPTPMSVRPFSPSESFAFPKPPAPSSSTADSFFISGSLTHTSPQSSATTLVHLSTPPRAFLTDIPQVPVSTHLSHQTSTPSLSLFPSIAVSNPSVDPFSNSAKAEFADVEVIRRPFTPSLDDEIAVRPGDRVRIFRVFDDGWAFVEKLPGTASERHQRGLIPIDCFRETDQALLSFLAEKRVSYGSEKAAATAL